MAAPSSRPPLKRFLRIGALVVAGLFVLIQAVPYGRDHTNPTPTKQVQLPTAAQRELFATSCQDCHSFQTEWLWYSNVAPASWLIQSDVEEGRDRLNLSTWDRPQPDADEIAEVIAEGEMPPLKYRISPYHWNAKLSDADKHVLIGGFRALYAQDPPPIAGG
jgi:mono/diheme cytochrome c family protein